MQNVHGLGLYYWILIILITHYMHISLYSSSKEHQRKSKRLSIFRYFTCQFISTIIFISFGHLFIFLIEEFIQIFRFSLFLKYICTCYLKKTQIVVFFFFNLTVQFNRMFTIILFSSFLPFNKWTKYGFSLLFVSFHELMLNNINERMSFTKSTTINDYKNALIRILLLWWVMALCIMPIFRF